MVNIAIYDLPLPSPSSFVLSYVLRSGREESESHFIKTFRHAGLELKLFTAGENAVRAFLLGLVEV